jgi:hypothetical protein
MERNSGGPVRLTGKPSLERRTGTRFPLDLKVRYVVRGRRSLDVTGSGSTIDLSSSGLNFRADKHLQAGMRLDVYIDWPVPLDGGVQLQLVMSGEVVRTDGLATALRIERHEFRTKKAGLKVVTPPEFDKLRNPRSR